MQYSLLGLYRSLLHQILLQCPNQLTSLALKYKTYQKARGKHGVSWTWSEQELHRCLFDILINESSRRSVTVLVDALDEIGSHRTHSTTTLVRELISELGKVMNGHSPNNAGGKLKILVSCRYYPAIYDSGAPSILIEEENRQDISTLIETHQALNDMQRNMRAEGESLKKIIVKRASGIFLWVAIVLGEVTRLHDKGMSFKTIKKTVETVPETLHDLYQSLILSGDFDEQKQALKLFTWLIFAARPLSLAEFRDALATDAKMDHSSFAELSESENFYDLNAMEKVANYLSRGLVQVQRNERPKNPRPNPYFCPKIEKRQDDPIYDGRWQTLQLVHQSVLDYLRQEGLHQLAASTENLEYSPQWELSRSCIRYLLLENIVDKPFKFKRSKFTKDEFGGNVVVPLAFDFALTEYAHSFWLLHVMKVEEDHVDQQDLLQLFALKTQNGCLPDSCNFGPDTSTGPFQYDFDQMVTKYRTMIERVESVCQFWKSRQFGMRCQFCWALIEHPRHLTLIELLSLAGLKIAMLRMKELQPDSIEWKRAPSLLQYALIGRHQDSVDWILENLRGQHLRRLVDPDVPSPWFLPLTIAVAQGDQKIVHRLLKAGANVHVKTSSKWPHTMLGMAVELDNIAVVKELLNANANHMQDTLIRGAYFGNDIGPPHFIAAEEGYDDVLGLLLEQSYPGALTKQISSMRTHPGRSTLLHACRTETTIKTLLDHGADPNAQDYYLRTPLHRHCRSLALVQLLLDHGSDPTKRDLYGETPLQWKVGNSEFDEAYNLMFNWTDSFLRTAPMLHVLTCKKERKSIAWGWNIGENSEVATVVLIRTALDQHGISLDHDWNKQDREGRTLLAFAVEENLPQVVRLLLESKRVDSRIPDHRGFTPLGVAKMYGHHMIARILQKGHGNSISLSSIKLDHASR